MPPEEFRAAVLAALDMRMRIVDMADICERLYTQATEGMREEIQGLESAGCCLSTTESGMDVCAKHPIEVLRAENANLHERLDAQFVCVETQLERIASLEKTNLALAEEGARLRGELAEATKRAEQAEAMARVHLEGYGKLEADRDEVREALRIKEEECERLKGEVKSLQFNYLNESVRERAFSAVNCNCATEPPTMPTCRIEHLETCPVAYRQRVTRLQERITSLESDLAKANAALKNAEKTSAEWEQTANMFSKAWDRELGPRRHKTHLIDELVVGTRELRADLAKVQEERDSSKKVITLWAKELNALKERLSLAEKLAETLKQYYVRGATNAATTWPAVQVALDAFVSSGKGEPIYPCEKCGRPRTKDQGGTVFTVCDECWDMPTPSAVPLAKEKHEFEGRTKDGAQPKAAGSPGQCPRCEEAACICEWEICALCKRQRSEHPTDHGGGER